VQKTTWEVAELRDIRAYLQGGTRSGEGESLNFEGREFRGSQNIQAALYTAKNMSKVGRGGER